MESLQTPRAISSTARRHGISRSLLVTWRRSFRPAPTTPEAQQAGFVIAFTDFGIENLIDLIKIYKEDPTLLKRWDSDK